MQIITDTYADLNSYSDHLAAQISDLVAVTPVDATDLDTLKSLRVSIEILKTRVELLQSYVNSYV